MVKSQSCIGVFLKFMCKRLLWIIKNKGEFWPGEYFRYVVLAQNVFSFLKDEENVIDLNEVLFVHDKATRM